MAPQATRATLIACALLGLGLLPACRTACPKPSPIQTTEYGRVEFCDRASRRRLRVTEHKVERLPDGVLQVTVEWVNTTAEPFPAQVRIIFRNARDYPEVFGYVWAGKVFQPGSQESEWTSRTRDSVRYLIQVRKAP